MSERKEIKENTEKDCPICIETSDCTGWIKCQKCNFSTCFDCMKTYLMNLISLETPCMNCKAQWDYAFLHDTLPEQFFYDYQIKKAKLLQEREKSLLPETQLILERQKKLDLLKQRVKILRQLKSKLISFNTMSLDVINNRINTISCRIDNIMSLIYEENRNDRNDRHNRNNKRKENVIDFFGHCPNNDCKGFLVEDTDHIDHEKHEEEEEYSSSEDKKEDVEENKKDKKIKKKPLPLKCPLCMLSACRKCRLEKHKGKCDPNLVKNIKALEKETKPCPACKTRIYKIDGCDQMFCMSCHTAFSWEKGIIETGRIHNPHYYEWLRKNNNGRPIAREVDDCALPNIYNLNFVLARCGLTHEEDNEFYSVFTNIFRQVGHINHQIRPIYTGNIDGTTSRIKYLKNELTEKQWIFNLKRKLKDSYKEKAIADVLGMLYAATNDIFGLILESKNKEELYNYQTQLNNLKDYANETFVKIGKLLSHNKLIPFLDNAWNFKASRAKKGRKKESDKNSTDDEVDEEMDSNIIL